MSKVLSLKLREDVFEETEKIIRREGTTRNRYINEAIDFYNRVLQRRALKKRLAHESALVSRDSLAILEEFEALEENRKIPDSKI